VDDETSPERYVAGELHKLVAGVQAMLDPAHIARIVAIADAATASLRGGGKAMFCGNGGSAADAQHLAAELVGRQNFDRSPTAGLALTVDTSVLTALGNDYGYDTVFARQVEALGRPGDILFALSTSGRSTNAVAALAAAARMGITTVAVTGADPRHMGGADHVLAVPAVETAKIQELTLTAGHAILALVERALFA